MTWWSQRGWRAKVTKCGRFLPEHLTGDGLWADPRDRLDTVLAAVVGQAS